MQTPSPVFPGPAQNHEHQNGSAKDLPSMGLQPGWLPQVMRGRDMTVLCLITVLLITNVSLLAGAGGAAIVYLCLGFLFFLLPSALICMQLHRLFPGEGAVYRWANRAFGNFWDTFVGLYCNWLPGVLGMTIGVVSVVTYLQALNPNWLTQPWQQGLVDIVVLVLVQVLCLLSQRRLQHIINVVFAAYASLIVFIGLAGVLWLLGGHAPQGDFSAHGWQIGPANFPVFAIMVIILFGMEVPLNMGDEVTHRQAIDQYLLWGTLITIVGYLLATFGIAVVLPPSDAVNSALIAEIFPLAFGHVIGGGLQVVANVIMVCYFVIVTVAFNVMFSRLLLIAGVDRRLPRFVRRLRANRIPWNAMLAQTCTNIGLVSIIFFIAPAFAPANQTLSLEVFLVAINGGSVIWNFAMIGLFLCGIILFSRFSWRLRGNWIAPPFLLYGGAATGIICSCIAIYSTLFAGSPIPQLISNADWLFWMLLVVLGGLAVGAAYSFLVPEAEDLLALQADREKLSPQTLRSPSATLPNPAPSPQYTPGNSPPWSQGPATNAKQAFPLHAHGYPQARDARSSHSRRIP